MPTRLSSQCPSKTIEIASISLNQMSFIVQTQSYKEVASCVKPSQGENQLPWLIGQAFPFAVFLLFMDDVLHDGVDRA